jgi:hypothetical protein
MQQFNSVSNVKFTDADLAKYRSIPLGAITLDPHGVTKIMGTSKNSDLREFVRV